MLGLPVCATTTWLDGGLFILFVCLFLRFFKKKFVLLLFTPTIAVAVAVVCVSCVFVIVMVVDNTFADCAQVNVTACVRRPGDNFIEMWGLN